MSFFGSIRAENIGLLRVRLTDFLIALAQGMYGQRLIFGCLALYFVGAALVAHLSGFGRHFSVSIYSEPWLLGIAFVAFTLYPLKVMVWDRPERLFLHLLRNIRNFPMSQRFTRLLPFVIAVPVFFSTTTSIKTLIPAFKPFTFDPEFAAIDRWLHGGTDPWLLLHPLLGYPLVTTAINTIYNFWFILLIGVLLWQVVQHTHRKTRTQFLVTFVLLWVLLGNIGAVLLSSGGPCFYEGLVDGENPFAPLMTYLRETGADYPVWAVSTQDMLWERYIAGTVGIGAGISAMPSMHVATAVLFAIVAWYHSRVLGWLLTIYAFLILIGSVHLAWHYAIDGYVSIIATLIIWSAVGRGLDRFPHLADTEG